MPSDGFPISVKVEGAEEAEVAVEDEEAAEEAPGWLTSLIGHFSPIIGLRGGSLEVV